MRFGCFGTVETLPEWDRWIQRRGWTSVGYHDRSTFGNFNNYDGRVQLGQQWFFAEKIADGTQGLGVGGRIDYVYGTDAPDTQAFESLTIGIPTG